VNIEAFHELSPVCFDGFHADLQHLGDLFSGAALGDKTKHLALAWQSHGKGELLLAGALAPPTDRAVLLFQGESPAAAENFARNDPYVTSGLVQKWTVRQWNTVAGADAASPLRPGDQR